MATKQVPNPWQRLAMRTPSVFAQDPNFSRKNPPSQTSETASMGLGVMSKKGEAGYLQRVAVRKNNITITRRSNGEIPQAMRSRAKK
jgi:hypothetical protein